MVHRHVQVEEEEFSDMVLNRVKAASQNETALQSVDRELGERKFKFPRRVQHVPGFQEAAGKEPHRGSR
ncbi:MAG: hypothetical protein HPY61_11015 [Methanotrichaceae archaeon]|nr:hypothetical protein [Methanotrichaceae archaeon]